MAARGYCRANFQGDAVFDVAGLDCILEEGEADKSRYTENSSKHSRFANLVVVNFVAAVRTGGDGMKFLSALRGGVSGLDRLCEICSTVPFSITGTGTRHANLQRPLQK